MHKYFFFIFFLLSVSSYSQVDFSGEATVRGMYFRGENLPFWMYHNQRGRISENTNVSGWISGKAKYDLTSTSSLEIGAGVLYQDGNKDNLFLDESYLQFSNSWLQVIAGRRQQEELYNGLSASNRSILWSLNARPLPGLQIKTRGPVFVFPQAGLGFEASWSEYLMEEDRHVSNAKIHHKNMLLVFKPNTGFSVKAGLQHFVQWGGTSANAREQPGSFDDYLRIISVREGAEGASGGDQLNALGNHLGGYEIYVNKSFPTFDLEILYNHIFDDKSGRRLGNTPDGRYGIFVNLQNKQQWVNSFIYEIYYTKHQSSTTTGNHIWDDYFNNFLYRSGWTYHQNAIGAPFFIPNFYDDGRSDFIRIGNNNFLAHHLGISGMGFKSFPYKFLASYSKNYGHYRIAGDRLSNHYPPGDPRGRFVIPNQRISTHFDVNVLRSFLELNLLLSADFSPGGTTAGAGINLRKTF